jgi:hypothetical protein
VIGGRVRGADGIMEARLIVRSRVEEAGDDMW